jgi:hypothetical protein
VKIHRLTANVKIFGAVEEVVNIKERGTEVVNDRKFFKKTYVNIDTELPIR